MKNQYLETVFQYNTAGKPDDFWVITAYNPLGKNADRGANLESDRQLRDELERRKLKLFRVIGLSPDESHAEPGWGIACEEALALKLGRKFRQDALFHFHAGRIDLVDCKSGKRDPLDHPADRIRDPRSLRHFTLFVGSPAGSTHLGPLERAGVCTRIGALFESFTIQSAEGCFRSRFEDSVVVHIATREPRKVIEAAHSLRCFLNQDGVGIAHNGIYLRVCEWSDDEILLEALGADSASTGSEKRHV